MMVKLCYDDSELASKPWRKKKDIVNKNKRCKQTVVESDSKTWIKYLAGAMFNGSGMSTLPVADPPVMPALR